MDDRRAAGKGLRGILQVKRLRSAEHDKVFDQGNKVFNSLLVGSKGDGDDRETNHSHLFPPKIDMYDINFFCLLESMLYDVLDNYENTNLMRVTDSLSYAPITKIEELGVAVENLIDEGMFLLFMNERSAHVLFDEFKKLLMPIPISD